MFYVIAQAAETAASVQMSWPQAAVTIVGIVASCLIGCVLLAKM